MTIDLMAIAFVWSELTSFRVVWLFALKNPSISVKWDFLKVALIF